MRAARPLGAQQKKPFHCERRNLIVLVFAQREVDIRVGEDFLCITAEFGKHRRHAGEGSHIDHSGRKSGFRAGCKTLID
jgi:hypothetical protein